MANRKSAGWGIPFVISVITLLIIGVSMLVLSGHFSKLVTNFVHPKASMAQPVINQSLTFPFTNDKVPDPTHWIISKIGDGVNVYNTTADNLRMDIPGIAKSQKSETRAGRIIFKPTFKDNADFRVTVVMYKPIIYGDGAAVSGIAFSSPASSLDTEGAALTWQVASDSGKKRSQVVFRVNSGSNVLINKAADLDTNVAVLSLIRVNGSYRAVYHVGADLSGDTANIVLGEVEDSALGQEGQVRLLTNNAGTKTRVVGRFDTAYVGWQNSNKPTPTPAGTSFRDSFGSDVLNTKWTQGKSAGSSIVMNPDKTVNLIVAPGAVNGTAASSRIVRTDPTVGIVKNFSFTAWIKKPLVIGDGIGAAGVNFSSNSVANKEAAQVRWNVGKDAKGNPVSRVIFLVYTRTGALVEQDGVNVNSNMIGVQLRRNGSKYSGWYTLNPNDPDYAWKQLGSEQQAAFGEDGKFGVFAGNVGNSGKYPFVSAEVDTALGTVQN